MSPKPAATPVHQTTLTPTSYSLPAAPASVRSLSLDKPRTQGLLTSTTWLKGAFAAETEIAANQGGTAGLRNAAGNTGDDAATRMMRLGLTGSTGPIRYGMTYRNAGHAYYNGGDQAVKEVWGEWRVGVTTVRSAVGQQWNNVDGDPLRPRSEQNYGRLGLSWGKPAAPNLSLTLSQNAVNSAPTPLGIAPQKLNTQTLEAALGYGGAAWSAKLASSYGLNTDLLHNGSESRVNTQTVSASFRPLDVLTIAPTLGYRAEQQDWSGVRIDSPSASLSMKYAQSQGVLISAMGSFSETRSSDRLVELETMGGNGTVAWELQQTRDWKTTLSLEAGYNRQVNRMLPSAQTEDLSGILRLVLATL